MAVPLALPLYQFFDDDGAPLENGTLETYIAGTTTPKATYTDATGLIALQNPVPLDAAGRAVIWIQGSYYFVLKDKFGNIIKTMDNVTAFNATPGSAPSYFQSFSGNNVQVAFNLSQDLGVDENAIMVFVSVPAFSQVFTGTGAQTIFTLSQAMGTNSKGLYVTVAGVRQDPSTYTVNGVTLTFASAPAAGAGNIAVVQPSSSPASVLNPNQYTLGGSTLTFAVPPTLGVDNILIFAPSTLVAAASASAAAAEAAADAAALSAASAASIAAGVTSTSTTSNLIGGGSVSFTTQTGKQYAAGQFISAASNANPNNYMHGNVTSYNSGTGALIINVTDTGGSGTYADWNISVSGSQGTPGTFNITALTLKSYPVPADQAPLYDVGLGQNVKATIDSILFGANVNAVINGGFNLIQRFPGGSSILTAANGYVLDRWYATVGASTSANIQQVTTASPCMSSNASRVQRVAANTGTNYMGLIQVFETSQSRKYRGKRCVLRFRAAKGANFSGVNLQAAVSFGTGTDQSASSFSVGTWTTQTVINSVAILAATLTANYDLYELIVDVPSNANQLGIAIGYFGTGSAGANDYIDISDVYLGPIAFSYFQDEQGLLLIKAQRFFETDIVSNYPLAAVKGATAQLWQSSIASFLVEKRVMPTVVFTSTFRLTGPPGSATVTPTAITPTSNGTKRGVSAADPGTTATTGIHAYIFTYAADAEL